MLQFLKFVLATLVGLFLFIILSFFIIAGIGSAFSSEEKTVVKSGSVLKLDLNKPIQEVGVDNPFSEFAFPFGDNSNVLGLKDIREALSYAATDDNVKGIYLKVEDPSAGWASLEEIRNELLEFKKSKKFIYSYGEYYSEKGYYLASVADKIYLNPAGGMEWNGLSAEYDFYQGTFEKLEIKPLVFRVGEFKSAIEMFSRKDMSEASKQQSTELLSALYSNYLEKISKSRNISTAELNGLADSLAISNPASALKYKLITHAAYHDELETALKKELKLDDSKKIEYVGLQKYMKADHPSEGGDFNKRVAVIVAEGEIVSGNSTDGVISSEKFVKELKAIRENDKIKAVVIRINSPGGSSLASDVMWREIELTTRKKPVIASMSDVAASGGYYMAMGCDTIVAQPNTITGSIGIFAMLFNIEDFMSNKLGVTFDGVKTNPHADWPTLTREMTEFEKAKIQSSVNEGYATFTTKAAKGRNMSVEKLRSLASGRVWSGVEAKANGLVDVLGGLDEAISLAAKAAKLKEGDYRVRFYPEKIDPLNEFMQKLTGDSEKKILNEKLGELAPYVKMYHKLMNMQGLQARMPFEMQIR
ncbi:signal peptide peptidase SppA [Arundinibacter roseus]|uniref:Signal peptide peptidase SppA n=1 Tax=Arundinibacter roseus TaxID=2070510 RepID=A0A4R4KE86_9BACT|nr:signal peptide peptidase SppA [Arundinibacter roseus]TDB65092.1 signal peptide peptidase SppA [Arundinibacter roseus]